MASNFTLRDATSADLPGMLESYFSGFESSPLNTHCFPPSSPQVRDYWSSWILKNIDDPDSHVILAVLPAANDAGGPTDNENENIVGWACWVRKQHQQQQQQHLTFSPSSYPHGGALVARFFQANYDATRRTVGSEAHWFLSIIVVRRDAQRRGVGGLLMRWGVDRADRDGWMAYVNGSAEGRGLYERFGFVVAGRSEMEELGMTQFHMKRETRCGRR